MDSLSTKAADKLFVNGVGTEATRLVMVVDNPNRDVPYLDISRWCKQAVIDIIATEYEPVMEVLREALEMECLRGRRVHCIEQESKPADWCLVCKAKALFKLEEA